MDFCYKVSVITVSLNAESFIEEAIKSVLDQTYPNIEYIIIDGGSTDKTLDIINRYRDRIGYFSSEPDNGLFHAMNKGLAVSLGEIIFFLNADDTFSDNKVVQDVLRVFNGNKDLDLIFGDQIFNYGTKKKLKKQSFKITKKQLARMTLQHQTIFAKKALFKNTNGFSEEYRIVSDYDWILNIFLNLKCNYLYIDRAISVMSTEGLSWTTSFEKERIRVMKNHFSFYEILSYRYIPLKLYNLKIFIKGIIYNFAFLKK